MFRALGPVYIGFLVLAAVLVHPVSNAKACGGFFCSANAPVNQAAERIIFSKNADGTVTAVVQIQYSGPSEDFAWVLPVPGIPDIDVSSDLAFTRLQNASNPQYNLTVEVEGKCRSDERVFDGQAGAGGSGGSADAGASGDAGVTILSEGNVGPYDFVVIQPDSGATDPGAVAVQWLLDEGYDVVPPGGDQQAVSDMLGSYFTGGMNLIAFRLTKGNEAGTIRPIVMTYASERPMIPIRPTAVAADDDMGVMVWVLGPSRAITTNYKTLELNEALVDWLTGGSNYNQVVIAAANEAGGQGFVTERAGPSSDYANTIYTDFDASSWLDYSSNASSETPTNVLVEGANQYGFWDGFRDATEPLLPTEVDVDDFLQCPECLRSDLGALSFDVTAFIATLQSTMIDPMKDTQALIGSRPYVSRLYTTLSAPEMDRDPEFDFNSDVPDVANLHNARRIIECNPSVTQFGAPWRVELEDGRTVRGQGFSWPLTTGTDGLPANERVLELDTTGEGTVVSDNTSAIKKALDDHNATIPRSRPGISGGGCAIQNTQGPLTALGVLALGLLAIARRSRRL